MVVPGHAERHFRSEQRIARGPAPRLEQVDSCVEYRSVICVDKREDHGPVPGNPDTRLRIDLLSIEQDAWYLASCHDAFGAVTTLTELKARTGENRISVWAPARIVLGSGDSRKILKSERPQAQELAIRLARSAGARRLVARSCVDDLLGKRGPGEGVVQNDFALTPNDL